MAPKPLPKSLPKPKRLPRVGATAAEQRRALWAQLEANPEATLEKHREMWEREHGVRVSVATMSRAIRKLGWSYRKRRPSLRARRAGAKRLEGAGRTSRPRAVGVRRRVWHQHWALAAAREGAQGW